MVLVKRVGELDKTCNICGTGFLRVLPRYSRLPRVSSDCKPIAPGGVLAICEDCGGISKQTTEKFLDEISDIYSSYDVYYQGGGMEQVVYDHRSGGAMRRSHLLMKCFYDTGLLDQDGSVIDIGCGNGKFLSAFSNTYGNWQLSGLELDHRHEAELQKLLKFDSLIVGDIKDLEQRFDLITMVHALEHFIDPFEALVSLRGNLSDKGLVFIQVPNVARNPFDLLIADHVSHFSAPTLSKLLTRAGYEIVRLETDWVTKELSVFARQAKAKEKVVSEFHSNDAKPELAKEHVAWLESVLVSAKDCASSSQGPFGLFGTSIAATWLVSAMGSEIEFFLDDDVSRQGTDFFGNPVLAPADAPPNSSVFIGLAPVVASVIAERMRAMGHDAYIPTEI